jgi:hypothetical protein
MVAQAKLSVFCAALVAALLLLAGGAAPAMAHAGPDHRPSAATTMLPEMPIPMMQVVAEAGNAGVLDRAETGAMAVLTDLPGKAPLPLQQGNCCCGSIACHAGMVASFVDTTHRYSFSEWVRPRPDYALTGTEAGGIERPPRGNIPL